MTDARQTPEDSVIKHVREQHNAEPPAHLDAFILNAAQRQTLRRNQACGNAGWTLAANHAGRLHSPASSAWH